MDAEDLGAPADAYADDLVAGDVEVSGGVDELGEFVEGEAGVAIPAGSGVGGVEADADGGVGGDGSQVGRPLPRGLL